jgi:hypothetical protein
MEGQSPKLKAAIASQNYEEIFVVRPANAHSIMVIVLIPIFAMFFCNLYDEFYRKMGNLL